MSQSTYSITEISNWANDKKFNLPNVQRGFVWKPYQIEDLWDSILRGYPIGCFVLSKSAKSGNEKYEILDGQQRATSISLGFDAKTFRDTDQNVKLFIDLGFSQTENGDKKYLFRVITKSHPWGYEKRDNQKTLDAVQKRDALNAYGVESHLDKSLDLFFPYDAVLPVPFSFLIHAKTFEEALSKIKKWKLLGKIRKHYQKQNVDLANPDFDQFLIKHLKALMIAKESMLSEYPAIPALYLNLDKFINDDKIEENLIPSINKNDEDSYNESSDEIENLFIRLNNHGTPLSGEELNYSILKAHISKDLQSEIENACQHFIRPSRFITILFRIFSNEPGSKTHGNIALKIKAKVFQRAIAEDRSKFADYIKKVLTEKQYLGQTLLNYTKSVLAYHPENNKYGFPFTIYSRLAEAAPEVMFTLFFRVKIMGDRFDEVNSIMQRKMLGTISLMYWLGKGERNKNYIKLLRNIWPSVSKITDPKTFWSKSTLNRARIDNVMSFFPSYNGRNGLKNFFNKRVKKVRRRDREPFILDYEEEILWPFIYATLYEKDLVAYSQRDFLYKQFLPDHYGLEDTNIPFDWDHISPQNAIAIKPVPKPIGSVYNTIGNFRAWPYSLNREDQAITPYKKFNPLNESRKEDLPELLKEYQRLLKTEESILTRLELKKILLDVSICDKEWENCDTVKLKDRTDWEQVYLLIMKRVIKLYQKWYDELRIDDLYPVSSKFNFESLFYKGKWGRSSKNDKIFKEYVDSVTYDFWLSGNIDKDLYAYFGFKRELNLAEDEFFFGVIEKSPDGLLSKIKIPTKFNSKYLIESGGSCSEIYGLFTLISTELSSYRTLLSEIYSWVDKFPDKALKSKIIYYIKNNLKKENINYFTANTNNK
ncbi:MAG: DUF262 domain-containing protein [Chitinophagaceae bacterium]|nr:DUF262 domain-containing protein [Chitinophagaceae bacterium]